MRPSLNLLIKLTSLTIIFSSLSFPLTAIAKQNIDGATVKIYTVSNSPDYDNPWNMSGSEDFTGSGCIIADRRILTNAHVVENHTFVEVRRHGDPTRYQARVLHVAPEVDLALLTVDDPQFFSGVTPLRLGPLPALQQEVQVYGFPEGGDTLSITKGVISRIEHTEYTHSRMSFLMVQIDAAINSGNSGGPAIVNNRIAGIAVQSMVRAQNIGYIIPPPVITHFLTDVADGTYNGFPRLGVELQDLANPAQRARYSLPGTRTGALVTRISPSSPVETTVQLGDVLLAVDGHNIADGLSVEFRPKEWTSFAYYIQDHQIGDTLELTILRQGSPAALQVSLDKTAHDYDLVSTEFDVLPRYYIFGGLVFIPLTTNYLKTWGDKWFRDAPITLLSFLQSNDRPPENQEVILLLKVLAADTNRGYHDLSNVVITKVNGHHISSLRHLIRVVEEAASAPFIVFEDRDGQSIVLDAEKAIDTNAQILATYHIDHDRSQDSLLDDSLSQPFATNAPRQSPGQLGPSKFR